MKLNLMTLKWGNQSNDNNHLIHSSTAGCTHNALNYNAASNVVDKHVILGYAGKLPSPDHKKPWTRTHDSKSYSERSTTKTHKETKITNIFDCPHLFNTHRPPRHRSPDVPRARWVIDAVFCVPLLGQ